MHCKAISLSAAGARTHTPKAHNPDEQTVPTQFRRFTGLDLAYYQDEADSIIKSNIGFAEGNTNGALLYGFPPI